MSYIKSFGVCRLSVCVCVCLSVNFFAQIAYRGLHVRQKWLDRDQTCTGWSAGGRASRLRSRSRSKVTWYGHFCAGHENRFFSQANGRIATKLAHDGPRWACIQGVLKVVYRELSLFWSKINFNSRWSGNIFQMTWYKVHESTEKTFFQKRQFLFGLNLPITDSWPSFICRVSSVRFSFQGQNV